MKIAKSKRNTVSAASAVIIILMSFLCASCSSTLSFKGLGNPVGAVNTNSSRTAVYDRSLGGEEIDWDKGFVVASGRSAVSSTGNASQDIIVAEKAARTLAYERLAEIISGINIDSQRTISMEMLTDSILSGRVSAFIKGARVVSSDYKTYPDGSGYVEVVLTVNMNGEGGLTDIASDAMQRPLPGLPPEIYIPSESTVTTPAETSRGHSDTYVDIQRTSPGGTGGETVAELIGTTGLIVDASGLGAKTKDSNFYRVHVCAFVKSTVSNNGYSYGITQSDNVEIHYDGEDCAFAGKSLSEGLLAVGITTAPYGGNVRVFFQCGEIERGTDAVTGLEVLSTFFSIRAERTGIRGDICNVSQTRIAGVGKTASSAMENMVWNGDLQIRAALLRYCTAVPVELTRLRIASPESTDQPELFLNRIKSIRWTRKTEVRSVDDYTFVVDVYSSLPSPVFSRRLSLISGVNVLREDHNMIDMYYSASQVSSSRSERWR